MNWILKIIMASMEILPVKATQPIRGGKAPGIAPIKTAIGPTLFNGV